MSPALRTRETKPTLLGSHHGAAERSDPSIATRAARAAFLSALLLTSAACTDPLAGNWQSYGPGLTGDFLIYMDGELNGDVDFRYRTEEGVIEDVESKASAFLMDRNDGVWTYGINVDDASDLSCDLKRSSADDRMTCEWRDRVLDFRLIKDDEEAACSHGICEEGTPLDEDCNSCTVEVCEVDAYCCNSAWDRHCIELSTEECPQIGDYVCDVD